MAYIHRRLRPKRQTFPRAILQYPAERRMSLEEASAIKRAWLQASRTKSLLIMPSDYKVVDYGRR